MAFGMSSGGSNDVRADEITELKNRIKLLELDLEKRLTLLENSEKEMQKAVVAVEDFDSSKNAMLEVQEIKKTLREIEDTGLIAKLETISNGDKIAEASETIDALNQKIILLSDAVELMSESKNGDGNSSALSDLSSIREEIDGLKNALPKTLLPADQNKFSELEERVSFLEKSDNKTGGDLKKAYDAYCEKVASLERRISSVSSPQETQKDSRQEILKMRGDIEKIKEINKKIVETIEINSKAFDDLKIRGTAGDGTERNAGPEFAELSVKVAEIMRELNLDRAMYPQDLMNIKKEMNALKAAQKSLADALESVSKMKKGANASGAEDKIKIADAFARSVSGKIPEISRLEEKLKAIDGEIGSIKASVGQINAGIKPAEKAGSRSFSDAEIKKINDIEKTVAGFADKIGSVQALSEKIRALDAKVSSYEGIYANARNNNLKGSEETGALLAMIKKVSEENNTLRQEIEQLKQICAEIINENRAQPIIID